MRHKGLFTICLGGVLTAALAGEVRATSYDVDAFVDDLLNNATLYDIGERTAFTPPNTVPPIGPTAAINNPILSGRVRGQFEYTCGDSGPNGTFGPEDCPDAAYAASAFNWKWGVLQATDQFNSTFIDVAGTNFFPSDLPLNEGITSVDTNNFENTNPATRIMHFEFNLQGAGVILTPGYDYIIFAMYAPANITLGNRVPGEGPGFTGFAEESIYQSAAVDAPPNQFHQNPPLFDPNGETNQLATSRLIPITPEPASLTLVLFGAVAVLARRKTKAAA
jgi:hypothetical protein